MSATTIEPEVVNRSLRIAIADDEGFMRKYLQTVLPRLGHQVVGVARTGRELIEQCSQIAPDLVITDINMPEIDGLEAAAAIYQQSPVPIIVISGYHGPELIERTVGSHVMAYLVKPVKQADLNPVITMAMERFDQLQRLRTENDSLRNDRASRSTIERALQILMKWMPQQGNHTLGQLREMADEKHLPVFELAQLIVTADAAIAPADSLGGEAAG